MGAESYINQQIKKINIYFTTAICVCYLSTLSCKVILINSKKMPRKKKKYIRKITEKELERNKELIDKYENLIKKINSKYINIVENGI